jgi:fatty acid desaturase
MGSIDDDIALADTLKQDARTIRGVLKAEGLSLRDISRPSDISGATYVVGTWCLFISFAALWLTGTWYWQLLAFIGLGITGHALLLIMHEASHHSLFQNRTVNDFVGDYLVAVPASHTLESYRATHFLHHKYVNPMKTPRALFPIGG